MCLFTFPLASVANPYEYQPFQCAFDIDLDADAPGIGYAADTLCYDLATPVAAPNCALTVESGRMDSLVVWVESGAGRLFTAAALPPPLSAQGDNTARLTLAGRSPDTENDYRAALQQVRFQPEGGPGAYTIAVAGFDRLYGRTDTARAALFYVAPAANAGLDAAAVLCPGDGATDLFALLGSNAQPGGAWAPALSSGAGIFQPGVDAAGAYRYIIPGVYGCPGDTAQVLVQVSALPVPELGPDTTLCPGQSLTLNAPAGTWQIEWSTGSSAPQLVISSPGLYTVELRDSSGCRAGDSIAVAFHSIADTVLTQASLCNGQSYIWQGLSFTADTSLCLVLSTTAGCDSLVCLALHFTHPPAVSLGEDLRLCPGDTATLALPAGFVSYAWSTGAAGPVLRVAAPGVVSVTVTDSAGCTASDSVRIEVSPNWNIVLSPAQVNLTAGDTLPVLAETVPPRAVSWLWQPGSHLSCDTCASVRIFPPASAFYQVRATDAEGCVQTISLAVTVTRRLYRYFAPNAFSPDDNGINDLWRILGEAGSFRAERVQIFNRWGGLVYEAQDVAPEDNRQGWDGTFRGRPADAGVYVFRAILRFEDGNTMHLSGEINLMR